MSEKPLNLERDAIHLGAPSTAVPVPGFEHDYEKYVAAHCSPDDPGRLVTLATSTKDWPVWETHPAGAEVVIVLSGRAEFIQDVGGARRHVIVGPNEAVINPPGVPHTANVIEPFTALYITPGPGTTHLPRT
ncbi:MAG: cupin domain-containing protein [Myxococcus sp.]|nr:cupin domain-containing protein [Myxococcus sp.]